MDKIESPALPEDVAKLVESLGLIFDGAPDCGDNSCAFAPKRGGMRTNGGCRCLPREMKLEDRRFFTLLFREARKANEALVAKEAQIQQQAKNAETKLRWIEELEAQLSSAREALEPILDCFPSNHSLDALAPDCGSRRYYGTNKNVHEDEIRKARAALAKLKE